MAIQNLRSSQAHRRAIPSLLSAGQICINTNEASPGLFFKDSNGDLVKVGPVHIGTSAPNSSPDSLGAGSLVTGTVYQILTLGTSDFTAVGASANTVGTIFTATGTTTGTGTVSTGVQGNEKGEQWLDTTGGTYVLKIYDGTAWRSESGTFVDVSGDTMTGALGVVAGSASAPGVFFSGDTNTGLLAPAADSVAITTGGLQRIVVDSSGRLGVGTTSPDSLLDLEFANSRIRFEQESGSNRPVIRGTRTSDKANRAISIGGSDISFLIGSTATTALTSADEKVRIDSSGRLLVGTTTEGASSADNLTIADSGHAGMTIRSGSNHTGSIYFSDATSGGGEYDGEIAYNQTSRFMKFATAQTEQMRIDSSGRVGVGISAPWTNIEVRGSNVADGVASRTFGTPPSNLHVGVSGFAQNTGGSISFGSDRDSLSNYCSYGAIAARRDSNLSYVYSGYLTFSTSNGTNLNEQMRLTSAGRLGIGTTSPNYELSINDPSGSATIHLTNGTVGSTSSDGARITGSGSGIFYLENLENAATVFTTNNTERMRIDSAGRLLVGCTSQSLTAKFVIQGQTDSANVGGYMRIITGTSVTNEHALGTISFGDANHNGANIQARGDMSWNPFGKGTSLRFSTTGQSQTGPVERMRIDSSGRLLVGTTTEGFADVADNFTIADSGNCGMTIRSGSSNVGSIYFSDATSGSGEYDGYIDYQHSSQALRFGTNAGTERVRITSDGKVGVGTVGPGTLLEIKSDGTAANEARFTINEKYNASDTGFGIDFKRTYDLGGDAQDAGYIRMLRGGGTTNEGLTFGVGNRNAVFERMRITSDGKLGVGTNNPASKLHIANSSSAEIELILDPGPNSSEVAYINSYRTSSPLGFKAGDAERMRIDSSGNVGIGTTSPNHRLTLHNSGTGTFDAFNITSGLTNSNGLQLGIDSASNVFFWHTANGAIKFATNNAERVRIDSSGNVGIGSSSPASLGSTFREVMISGNTEGAGLQLQDVDGNVKAGLFTSDISSAAFVRTITNHPLAFRTNNTERMRINSDGTVSLGIVDTASNATLHLRSPISNEATRLELATYDTYNGSVPDADIVFTQQGGTELAKIQCDTNTGAANMADLVFYTNFGGLEERMRIDSLGRVGINNSAPGSLYAERFVVDIGSAAQDGITIKSGTTAQCMIAFADGTSGSAAYSGYIDYNHSTNVLSFGTSGSEKMRINSSGRVGIGTSSMGADLSIGNFDGNEGIILQSASPNNGYIYFADGSTGSNTYRGYLQYNHNGDYLQVGTASVERMRLEGGGRVGIGPQNAGSTLNVCTSQGAGTSYAIMTGLNSATTPVNGTVVFRLWNNGSLQSSNNTFTALSDVKLKENIVDAGSQWDDIKNIRVRKYNFKESTGQQTHTQIGVIAQEAETISPGLVYESPDRDSDENDLGTTTKGFNYSVLYMKAVKALQEAMERIETLEQRLTDAGIA